MGTKKLLYVGEVIDYSDRWLIESFGKYYHVTICNVAQRQRFGKWRHDIVINRLYTSAFQRVGEQRVKEVIQNLYDIEESSAPVINSPRAYELDIDRLSQFSYFSAKGLPFIPTVRLVKQLPCDKPLMYPLVLKPNRSGRQDKLPVFENVMQLLTFLKSLPSDSAPLVGQPVIHRPECYRTEFVGDLSFTIHQQIEFSPTHLGLGRRSIVTADPFLPSFRSQLLESVTAVGADAFSVEYFMSEDEKNVSAIIDFNLASNYPQWFVADMARELREAWLILLERKLKEAS